MKKTFIIAEIGNTHEGSVGLAKCFIQTAAACGADAVKFQTHIFEAESLPDVPSPPHFKDESRKDYLQRTAFNTRQHKILKDFAESECCLQFISSPFSLEAIDVLESIGIKMYKIPSGEVTNIPLLKKIALTGKPILMSSGMSTWQELDNAVNTLKANKSGDITVLQCTSAYPCPPEKTGLNILLKLKNRYNVSVGFSDHTMGLAASIGAVVLGAAVIEKHLTLSRRMYGSDAKHSATPEEFKQMVDEIRNIEKCLCYNVDKDKQAEELKEMKIIFEKSIVSKTNIPKGTEITFDMIAFKKPGDGLKPGEHQNVIGKTAIVDIHENTKISHNMLK